MYRGLAILVGAPGACDLGWRFVAWRLVAPDLQHARRDVAGLVAGRAPYRVRVIAGKRPSSDLSEGRGRSGRRLFHWVTEGQSRRIGAFPTSGSGETLSLREAAFDQGSARLSPDQKWLAYESNESGVREVYVDAFPAQGTRHQVSTSGGSQPRWRRDGKALFFVTPDRRLMTVSFEGTGTPRLGIPRALFELVLTVVTDWQAAAQH